MGGEYHLGTGLAELLELAEEAIELHCALEGNQIGRASCRERVYVLV